MGEVQYEVVSWNVASSIEPRDDGRRRASAGHPGLPCEMEGPHGWMWGWRRRAKVTRLGRRYRSELRSREQRAEARGRRAGVGCWRSLAFALGEFLYRWGEACPFLAFDAYYSCFAGGSLVRWSAEVWRGKSWADLGLQGASADKVGK